jgi:SAM-dependent methyltransferase
MTPIESPLNNEVRQYWEASPCGTGDPVTGTTTRGTREWFERVEAHRYRLEPFIHSIAQFTRYHGKRLLEIGVGAGTDHLQWARAGAECFGVDLTDAAIDITRERLACYGLHSTLRRVDAEILPFPDASFDVVYSWGVIHHSERPEAIVAEVHRVLRPGGVFVGMVYARYSPAVCKLWIRRALLRGRPWRSLADVVWHDVESIGTKAYTAAEVRTLLDRFERIELLRTITPYDTSGFPAVLSRFFPAGWGWNIGFRAYR